MPRLPVPGHDSGRWGTLLNNFLKVEHNSNGTHNLAKMKAASLTQAKAALSLSAIIKSGNASIADDVLPPGIRVGYTTKIRAAYARAGTAPVGSALTIRINRNGNAFIMVSIGAGAITGSNTGLSLSVVAGDIITYDITAVGSIVPGADIAVDIVGS